MNRVYLHTTALYRAVPLALALAASAALANPQGGVVVEGAATIAADANTLNIHQQTDRVVIDWRSFNIDVNEHTRFYQPSSSSIALNRVRSVDPSVIAGRLSANGNVVLINPNGVFFTRDAKVDVNRLIVTSADIGNRDFMEGRMQFSAPGRPDALIRNEGLITAGEAGLVGLVAPNVENSGVIRARRVQLASADSMALDMYGDGLLGIAVSDAVGSQLVRHTGVIDAAGGTVELTAAAGRQMVNSLIDVSGEIKAPAVSQKAGRIVIAAQGAGGEAGRGHSTVKVNGALDVSGKQAGQAGGSITITGDDVVVGSQAVLDASGHSAVTAKQVNDDESLEDMAARSDGRAGGDIYIGGGFQGDGSVAASLRTIVEEGASLSVRGAHSGDGGRAIIWSDGATGFKGTIDARGGDASGDGGLVEVSGAKHLSFDGEVDATALSGAYGQFLLDPTDIVISSAVDSAVTAASPFEANADDAVSNLNVTTLQNALALANVTVRTRATGSQQGNITVNDAISWSANRSLTLDAHNDITVNASITARNALIFTAGGDVHLNASLLEHASGATLTFQTKNAASTIGVAGGAGMLNLSNADLDFIGAGWNGIVIGNAAGTGVMNVGARTWNAPVTLRSRTGEIQINGAQNFAGHAASIITRNLDVNANMAGTGALTIRPDGNITVGLGNGAVGVLNLDNTELDFIQDGFSSTTFGLSSSTAAMNVNAYSWRDPLTLTSNTGLISINGAQNMGASNLLISTGNLALNNTLNGTGTLTVRHSQTAGTMGIGTGAVGALNLDDAELANIQDGWGNVVFGLTTSTGAMNVNAATWQDNVTFNTSTGLMTIAGAQNVGSNNLTIATRNLALNNTLTGTGTLTIRPDGNVAFGIGTGAAGTLQLDDAEVANLQNGWGNYVFGLGTSTAAVNVHAATTWGGNVTYLTDSGVITINGAQNVGANNLTLQTDSDIALNAAVSGSGTLNIRANNNAAATYSIGTAGGNIALTNSDLAYVSDGWDLISFGTSAITSTGAITLGARSWTDNVQIYTDTGAITVSGAQVFNANDFSIISRGNIAFNAAVDGMGTLSFTPEATNTTVAVGGSGSNMNISAASIANIGANWGSVNIGRTNGTGTITFNGTNTWNAPVHVFGNTSLVNVTGAQNFQANDFTIQNANDITFSAAVNGTGRLHFMPLNANTSVRVGATGSNQDIVAATITRIGSGWNEVLIGRADGTGAITVSGASTWLAPLRILSNTGTLAISAAQNFGNKNFTIETNANPNITAAVNGTGTFALRAQNGTTAIGLGAVAGIDLTAAEIAQLTNGWSNMIFGAADAMSNITMGTATWQNPVLARTRGTITVNGVQTSTEAAGTAFTLVGDAGGNLINNVGASAFSTAGARWLLYADTLTDLTQGALAHDFRRYGCNYDTGCAVGVSVPASGNGVVYGFTPTLTISGVTANNKVYDGTTNATLDVSGAVLSGGVAGDVLTLDASGVAAAFDTRHVGTNKIVTVSGLALAGADMGYAFTQPTGILGAITAKTITIAGLVGDSKTYDGTVAATLSGIASLVGDILGDDVALVNSATAQFADKNAGTNKAISVTGFSLSGTDSNNYILQQPVGLTADINKALLHVSANNRLMTIGDSPTISYRYNTADLAGGDTLGTIGLTGAASVTSPVNFAALALGTYDLEVDVSGLSSTNYNFAEYLPRGVLTVQAAATSAANAASILPPSLLNISQYVGGVSTQVLQPAYAGAEQGGSFARNTVNLIVNINQFGTFGSIPYIQFSPELEQVLEESAMPAI